MTKKLFIPFFILGSLLIFSILPLFNYSVDRWRVLHCDYKKSYMGVEPNKTYLKTKYLLNNLEKYDTLLMGSSRTRTIDGELISTKTYNMTYSCGLIGIHLKNLKILLKNNKTIKNIWIGINDYIIWKNPKDFKTNFFGMPYGSNLIENINIFKHYLFKKPAKMDFDILRGKYQLISSQQILNPDNMKGVRYMETKLLEDRCYRQLFKKKKPTLLGYKDNKYRIKQAIQEIQEIQNLCKFHNIKLILFMYPQSYITYLKYNQSKIKEFKRELSKISDFHDFYRLDDISLNEFYWFDTSHFVPSIGDYIIDNIKKNTFLVTKENIENHIKNTNLLEFQYLNNISNKTILEIKIKFKNKIKIFDIANLKYKYYKNNELTIIDKKLIVTHNDPIIILNKLRTNAKFVKLNYNLDSPIATTFQLFYKENKNDKYNENNSYRVAIKKGNNKISLAVPAKYINNNLRVDLVSKIGKYKINDFSIYVILRPLRYP